MLPNHNIFTFIFSCFFCLCQSQNIPSHEIIKTENLSSFLKQDVFDQLAVNDQVSEAVLAQYFRDKFSKRFFYDWKSFESRFSLYNELYDNEKMHESRANDHMSKFEDSTTWVLPFNYLDGSPVNSYALRHLARQHKMLDIVYQYFYEKKDPSYINYFVKQMHSLNAAFSAGEYEQIEDGNGVYEAFRSGYRVLNWLSIHNMLLGEENYSDEDQLYTIATLLQHGAHLFATNPAFLPGNHQTRGMSALAMLAILLRDFEGTEHWFDQSMNLLKEHITKEINEDGFQFERSVHYHITDIGNYFYVYQLLRNSQIPIDDVWESQLKSLFTSLVKIAYPDKSAPVLQDDTNNPWAEKNNISGILTLGYLIFEDPAFGYFATPKVEDRMYWFVSNDQLKLIKNIQLQTPIEKSLHFPVTGYYVMREGWDSGDKMLIISAGLDEKKPDHQHGDMLGIQAMANGQVILPNYQVRYSLEDFDFFKNSMVKNVALVDDELQGKQWTPNKGNTGFGKFLSLPNPQVIAWKTTPEIDLFVGSHDGFENVDYTRQVIYLKNDFWIIKDQFSSENNHTYKQVWQGHHSIENGPDLLRASFENGSGCDIYQLKKVDEVKISGKRGKEWSVVSKADSKNFSFLTIIFPFKNFDQRIDENSTNPKFKDWVLMNPVEQNEINQTIKLVNHNQEIIFETKELKNQNFYINFSKATDIYIFRDNSNMKMLFIGNEKVDISYSNSFNTKQNGVPIDKITIATPGDIIEFEIKK